MKIGIFSFIKKEENIKMNKEIQPIDDPLEWKTKLKVFMSALSIKNIDDFLIKGSVKDYKKLGNLYHLKIKDNLK